MKQKLIRYILRALNAADPLPLPQGALVSVVESMAKPEEPTESDIMEAVKELQGIKWIQGATDPVMGVSWSLTVAGVHQARKL
jgi:hypothetical protein